jgi:hypothetical protein
MTDRDEERIFEVMRTLDPSPDAIARVEHHLMKRLEREQRSLTSEWIDVLFRRPFTNSMLAAAAFATIVLLTPMGSILLMIPALLARLKS